MHTTSILPPSCLQLITKNLFQDYVHWNSKKAPLTQENTKKNPFKYLPDYSSHKQAVCHLNKMKSE